MCCTLALLVGTAAVMLRDIHLPDLGSASLQKAWISNHPALYGSDRQEGGGEGLQSQAHQRAIIVQREELKTQGEKTLQCFST